MSKNKPIRSWIFPLLLLILIQTFGYSLYKGIKIETDIYSKKIQQMHLSIKLAKENKEELSRQIQMLNDPITQIEVAKEELGILLENESKVIFVEERTEP